ncbi:MAG: helix-turn-helix transcriptional regulator [Bacteroidota bacterium]
MKILTKGQYYGIKDSEQSFQGIHLSQYDYATGGKDSRTDWHYHENPYFMYVLDGHMKDCNRKIKSLCPAGSLMFNNWQEAHYGSRHSETAAGFHLEFEKSWFKEKDIDIRMLEGSQLIEQPQVHVLFAKLYQEFMLSDSFSKVTIELLTVQISDALSHLRNRGTNQKVPPWVEHLKELLHFETSDLSLDYLSKQLGVHPVHISRAAPKYLSVSLGAYIRQQKLKKAIPLLLNSNHSLTAIAYDTGFSDQSHFNKVFKTYFNVNPSHYRKSFRKNLKC